MASLRWFAVLTVAVLAPACSNAVGAGDRDAGPPDEPPPSDGALLPAERRAVSVSTSGRRVCVAFASGSVSCWGDNLPRHAFSEYGAAARSPSPTRVEGIDDAEQVSVGPLHACALRRNGRAACWGTRAPGSDSALLGSAEDGPVYTVPGLDDARSVRVGSAFACAQRATGAVVCWGYNDVGSLGDGTTNERRVPVPVLGLDRADALTAGNDGACALTGASVSCWGALSGVRWLTPPPVGARVVTELPPASRVAVGTRFGVCVQFAPRGLSCWGVPSPRLEGELLTTGPLRSLAVGDAHACAVLNDGRVLCWGANDVGQLGVGGAIESAPAGGLASWSYVPGVVGVVEVTAGGDQTCARTVSGRVWCWGAGWRGDGSGFDRATPVRVEGVAAATRVVTGPDASCALHDGGAVSCWGRWVQPREGSPAVAARVAPAGTRFADACLNRAGVFVLTAESAQVEALRAGSRRVAVTATADAVQLSCQGDLGCVASRDGSVHCWGSNTRGQLGAFRGASSPLDAVRIEGLPPVNEVRVGGEHACARTRDGGEVWCWGADSQGQLGDGAPAAQRLPARVPGIEGALSLAAGAASTCARTASGLWCWGANGSGQLGVRASPALAEPTAVPASADVEEIALGLSSHACARTRAGDLSCRGASFFGELGAGAFNTTAAPAAPVAGLGAVRSVSAGLVHTCAVQNDGSVWCWGGNAYGQLGANEGLTLAPALVPL